MRLVAAVLFLIVTNGFAFAQSSNTAPAPPSNSGTLANPLITSPFQGPAVYRGGTITTGGTSQLLMDVNANRHGWNFQNQSTSMCFLKVGATATTDNVSLRVSPGGFYETPSSHVSTGAINVTCALTGATFYSTEW